MIDPDNRPNEPDPITTREMNSHISYFLKRIHAWETAQDLAPVARHELPAQVRAEMDVWHHQIFGDASPLAAEGSGYRVLLATEGDDDVVTYEVQWGDMKAKIFETRGQIGVLFPVEQGQLSDAEHLYRTIVDLTRLCISGEFNWELRSRAETDSHAAFSTNPRQSIYHAPSWDYRLDAGVFDGRLYLLVYKRKGQLIGLEGGKWFDDDFRHRITKAAQRTK